MENYEISKHIEDFSARLSTLSKVIKVDEVHEEIKKLQERTLLSDFWDNVNAAQRVLKDLKAKEEVIENIVQLNTLLDDLNFYFEIHKTSEEDVLGEIISLVDTLKVDLEKFEIDILLNEEYDDYPAIIELHPGAGGTESQDWTSMLYRMYRRYAERKGYKFTLLDYQEGDEAGIKNVSFIIDGPKAYGYLKGEKGIHRLVRISPFDSNARRHTSFCALSITPEIDDDIEFEINPEDLKIDTYRASGAGGQHVNTTDSAVRITHLPTNTVVTCQNERSQNQNKDMAMKILKSKLIQLKEIEQEEKIKKLAGESLDISFGSQIRSYVFHPYSLVKDHRTNHEVGDINRVMDGDIDDFINEYLKYRIK